MSESTDMFIYDCNLCLSSVRSRFYTTSQILDSSVRSIANDRTCPNLADSDLGDLGLLEALVLGKLLSRPLTYD